MTATTQGRLAVLAILLATAACSTAPPSDPGVPDGAVARTRAFGEPCVTSAECIDGYCVAIASDRAICTRSCEGDRDCPDSLSWGCVSPSDWAERVCGCTADDDREICGDRLDNDCDGDVDDCRICEGRAVADDDPEHCGGCFHACRVDQECTDGACTCADEGRIECEGTCVDPSTNGAHCGACGNACGDGRVCSAGSCECEPEHPDVCSDRCVDTDSDPAHCGACGTACPAGQICSGGSCGCGDGDRGDLCPGVGCVDLTSDERHCGACGNACNAGEVCGSSECRCPIDGQAWCDGACIDVRSDVGNCGACGNACAAGQECTGGVCGCESGLACGGTCVPVDDPANCGACGRACAAWQQCAGGTCRCASGTDCGSGCVDLTSDPANCGGCGVACGPTQTCSFSRCVCPAGGRLCGSSCVDVTRDRNHCGACGTVCPASQVCSASRCTCPTGQTFCAASGLCVDRQTDETNCGACGSVCAAAQSCIAGACRCPDSGETYCAASGTCVSLSADPSNCGACGRVCAGPTTCSFGTCACPTPGETYCASSDTCLSLAADPANCGACGRVCPSGTACSGGVCRCPTGQTACGTSCVDTRTDASNCGGCGAVCTGGRACIASACACPAPAPASPLRLTATPGVSEIAVRAARGGSRVGMVWVDSTSGDDAIRFQLLNPDGTPFAAGSTLATQPSSLDSPDVAWNGSEWGVVFLRNTRAMFTRVDATGAPVGALVDLYAALGSVNRVRIAHAPGSGFAVAGSWTGGPVRVQVVGTGTGPYPPSAYLSGTGGEFGLAGAPDGRFGVVALGAFQVVNGDGTLTASAVTIPRLYEPVLAHDGVTWIAAGVGADSPPYAVTALRGPSLAGRTTVSVTSGREHRAVLALAGDGTATVLWHDALVDRHGTLWASRVRLPATTGAAVLISPATRLMTEESVYGPVPPTVVHMGPDRFVSVWADARWPQRELYSLAVDVSPCM